jgi:hypothetical protein
VSSHEFTFELALPDTADFETMIGDLAAAVFEYVGYAPDAKAELTARMRSAVADGAAGGRHHCRVAFFAHEGQLRIAVTYDGAAAWQTTRPLP